MSEIRDGRFGRLSPNGQHLACGAVQVSVDGVVVGPGTTPVWLDDGSILYTRQPDGALMRFDLGFAPSEIRPAAHEPSSPCVARDPICPTHFAWRERDGVHTNLGRHVPLMFRPTFAGADLCWCLDTGTTADLYREGRLVARTVHDIRGELDGRLCFVQVDGAEQWTCIEHPDGRVASWRLAGAQEYGPHVVDWRGEEWVLSHTRDDRLLLRTGNNGIVVATGATFEPDCAVLPDGRVRVIWADAAGVSRERLIEVTEPQVDLRQAPARDPWPLSTAYVPATDIAEIAIEDFLFVASARNGLHIPEDYPRIYTHHMQTRWLGATAVQQTKVLGDGARDAVWTLSGTKASGFIGLSIDYTDAKHGYRVMNRGANTVAALWPRTMPVGIAHRRDVPVDIVHVDGTVERATWGGYVEGVYRGPAMGDLEAGLWAVIVWDFSHVGKFERNVCRLSQGLAVWVETDERPDHAGEERQFVCTRNVARIPDPEPRFADALPTAPVTPPATPPLPETPVKIWAYNDADAIRVYEFLPLKYTTPIERGGLGRAGVDVLGYARWYHDAIRLLDGGRSVDATLREINRRINQIVGLPLDAWPGEPLPAEPETPPSRPSRLVGPLRIAGDRSAFVDDGGPVLPVLCHLGDGLSRWTRDPGGVAGLLDDIAAAGYDGVRTWTVLGGSSYWNGREVGPMYQGNYFDHVSAFAAALRARGLRWLVSQGDAMRLLPTTPERQAFMRALAERLDLELVAGVDAGNELLWNGETDPAKMRAAVEAFRAVLPCAVWSLTSPGSEEKADLDTFSGSVFDVHGYRDNRAWDKVRHIFSIGYEGKPAARLGIQSEPFGYGDLVSASANKQELTSGVMALACAVSLLSRQAWVYFSGPGVKSDAGQRLQDMPGFRETCAMRDALPRDLMTFGSLVHGGASQKGRRVFAVPGTDSSRCDHALHADSRFVCAVYGESWRQAYQEKTCQTEKRIDCGEAGYVIVGRV